MLSAMKKKFKAKPAKKSTVKKSVQKSVKNSVGLVPMGDRVLVKPQLQEESSKTSFGILIPDTAKEKPEQGVVVAVGPGKKNEDGEAIPIALSVGDTVMFSKYGYDEVKVDGTEYYLVREESILAILD
jgi:chaperonin GroES